MKLRLRNFESKETLRIEVPSTCSLLQLQETPSLSLSFSSTTHFYFSLNAKDLLHASSPHASLKSLGVASGDLLYFSLNSNAFSPESLTNRDTSVHESTQTPENRTNQDILVQKSTQTLESHTNQETPLQQSTHMPEFSIYQDTPIPESPQLQDLFKEAEVSQEGEGTESMDIDASIVGERLPEPYFLRKILGKELGNNGIIHKPLAIAVHAVLLDSGFVGFDPVSRLPIDRSHFPDDWRLAVTVHYCLAELLRDDDNSGTNVTDYVVLKFQTLAHFLLVYGSLVKGASEIYRLSLDGHKFAPALNLVLANNSENFDKRDVAQKDGFFNSYPEKQVFEFWKIVRDELALPLLIDLSYRTGLSLPACMMRLPIDLKLKILESLPGTDIARMGCVCTEMRYLASNNELWKQKFEEEFGNGSVGEANTQTNWKVMFKIRVDGRKKPQWANTSRWQGYHRVDPSLYHAGYIVPNPFGLPWPPRHFMMPAPPNPFPFRGIRRNNVIPPGHENCGRERII